jgi:hypothetical protein
MAAADTADSGAAPAGPASVSSKGKGEGKADAKVVAAPTAGSTAPPPAMRGRLVDSARAAIGLCAVAMFVGAFGVGHWYRVRKPYNGVLRTVHDPIVAAGLGVTAALLTAGLIWLAFRIRRTPLALATVVVGGLIAALGNAVLWLPGLAAIRTQLTFPQALETMRGTLQTSFWTVPPGLFWGVGSATVMLHVAEARRKLAPDMVDQSLWAGGLWLTAVGEAGALVFGDGTLPLGITATGMTLGLVLIGSVIKRRPLKDPPEGFVTRRQLVQKTLAALLVVQAWVGALWFYWKR